MLNVLLSSTAHFILPVARRGKTGDWCWRHPELKLSDGFRPGSSTFKTQQVQRLTVFKQKFHPRIKWSPQTFKELQKAQFDWLHWALAHPWYKLLTSESYFKKCDLYRSEDHQISWSYQAFGRGLMLGGDNTEASGKAGRALTQVVLPTPQSLFCLSRTKYFYSHFEWLLLISKC